MNEEEKSQEAEYRRGYREGYIIALNNITQMVLEMHMPLGEVLDMCFDHSEERLSNWMLEKPTQMVLAPEPAVLEPESPYDQRPEVSTEPQVHKLSDLFEQKEA